MKRRIVRFAMAICLILIEFLVLSKAFAQPEDSLHPCELYTQADVNALFKESLSAGRVRKATLPAGEICQYTFMKKGGTLGLKIRISTNSAIREEGVNDSAQDLFTKQKAARVSQEYAASKFKAIQGLGDDAFWSGSDLWILKGDALLIITVTSELKGSFKNREASENARYEQDIALSQNVAETILSRMKQEAPEPSERGDSAQEMRQ